MRTSSFWTPFLVALFACSLAIQVAANDLGGQQAADRNGDRIPDRMSKIPVPDDDVYHSRDIIASVGKARGKKFKTRVYAQFDGKTNKELRQYLGLRGDPEERRKLDMMELRTKRQTWPYPENFADYTYPTSFDASLQWPQCSSVINKIQNQGACGSCWAVSSASVITDRRCIYFNATEDSLQPISSWDMVSCCKGCSGGNGCNGGWPYTAFKWYNIKGVVTGGDYSTRGTAEGFCKPYPRSPDQASARRTPCNAACQGGYKLKGYKGSKLRGQNYFYISYEDKAVMWELMNRGPVVAVMDVYGDFYSYSSGVYRHLTGGYEGGHAIKLVGWGEDTDGTKYWKVANSWGEDWGEGGFFRILRGASECGFDYYEAVAGIVLN